MARAEFPDKTPQSLGQFWLASAENHPSPGMLTIDGSDVRLQVSPELTPMLAVADTAPGSASGENYR